MRILCAAIVLFALPARAEPATLSVERLAGAESCPDASALAARVAELEPSAELSAGAKSSARHLSVTLSRQPEHWAAEIVLSGPRGGRRTLTDSGATCAGLGEAVALTLAMLREAEADESEPPPAEAVSEPRPGPLVQPPPPPPPERPAPSSPAPELGLGVSAGGVAHVGLLARAGVGVEAGIELALGDRFRTLLGGLWTAPQSIDHGEGRVEVSLLALRLAACLDLFGEQGGVELAACAAQWVGRLSGSGHDYSAYTLSVARPWLAAGAGARLTGPLAGPIGWYGSVSGAVPLLRERFAVEGVSGVAFEPPPIGLFAAAGVSLAIW